MEQHYLATGVYTYFKLDGETSRMWWDYPHTKNGIANALAFTLDDLTNWGDNFQKPILAMVKGGKAA